ncbi:MAG TPA: glycosyltransferase family 39 protein [Blastocatellia bacterium]|nr:glycosyltransferase family 39 protein [Blastocatellia bacterium]
MRTLEDVEVSYSDLRPFRTQTRPGFFDRLEQRKLLVAFILVAVALSARVIRLDAASLAEDEANKVFAIRAYRQGDFTANAEHPMVMKLLCYASVEAVNAWNRTLGATLGINGSEETAMRLPNAIFGALTILPLLLLVTALLGFRVGFIASVLWAFGLEAIWFNRIVKEDTLLVFFMLMGFYLYNRAKETPAFDVKGQERLYALAGAAFGLMIASKYFVHYVGLNAMFYTLIGYDSRNNRPLTRRMWAKYFGGMVLAFAIFNNAFFLPQTWRYLWKYVNEELLTHHGYLLMDRLVINDATYTPGGSPWYFYFLFLWVKLPLPLLAAFIVGLIEIFRRRGDYPESRGYLFLRMMLIFWLPMSLVGVKFLRYSLSLMPLVYITAAVGVVAIWRALSTTLRRLNVEWDLAPRLAAVGAAMVFMAVPAITTASVLSSSYPGLWLNSFGRSRIGYFFPHDEYYDLGARESIRYIADNAAPEARMASEIPGVVLYYLERYSRPDIRSETLSQPGFSLDEGRPDFVLLQRGRVYFENRENFKFIDGNFPVVQSSNYDGSPAARVFRLTNKQGFPSPQASNR